MKTTLRLSNQRLARIELGGALGAAISSSKAGRLDRFIVGPDSDPVKLFSPEVKRKAVAGDWYGEHVGKWLMAAAIAAARTEDAALSDRVEVVASILADSQEADGYLGAYAQDSAARFTNPLAEGSRTWDIWVHSYAILGLLQVHRHRPSEKWIDACLNAYRLMRQVFLEDGRSILRYGNHEGLSSLIAIHPLAELSIASGDSGPADLALELVRQAENGPLQPVRKLLEGQDIARVGTGKIYQICWLLQGLARLGEVLGRPELIAAAKCGWQSIRDGHLTLGGGPWGGVGRHKEVFNEPGFFSPHGLVETCSTMAWIQLNRTLHDIEALPDYSEEIESSLYNSVLGAMDPGGEEWAYFTFPNGPRTTTYHWACCKSSGALALETAPLCFYSGIEGGLSVEIYGPSRCTALGNDGERIEIEQETRFPAEGEVRILVKGARRLRLRIPSWASNATIEVNGRPGPTSIPGAYSTLELNPDDDSIVQLMLPMNVKVHSESETLDHHGQEIFRKDYFAVTKGPIVFSAGLIDGFRQESTLRAPRLDLESRIQAKGCQLVVSVAGHDPIELLPYGHVRPLGSWRSTWLGVAWQ